MSKSEPISSKASPHDVATPNSLVTAVYEVISGPAEQERDWDRFRALFLPEARLIISAKTPEGATHFVDCESHLGCGAAPKSDSGALFALKEKTL